MSFRVITICQEKETNAKLLANVVAGISGTQATHVQTVHVMPSGFDHLAMSPYVQAVPLTELYDTFREIAKKIKTACSYHQKQQPVNIIWNWYEYEGYSLGDFRPYIEHGMASDLIVCAKPPDVRLGSSLPKALVTESATPVLVIPENYNSDKRFERISVAWNETPEAARAIRDALPLLKQAELVVVVNISKKIDKSSMKGVDISSYLTEHDIKIEIDHQQTGGDIGKDILEHVTKNYMDLLVMGGYGHSSLYNMAFGAATPHILKELSCPVFFSQ